MRITAFLLLLAACADPKAPAIATCQAVPGVATDEAGRALLQPLLLAEESAILAAAEPTLGLQKVGSDGLARLRAETTCVVNKVESAGTGRWQVVLRRTQPEVKADGSFGPPADKAIDWQAVDAGDGVRIETDLVRVSRMRAQVGGAASENDLRRVAGLWRSIADHYPDPLLAVDIDVATRRYDEAYVLGRLDVRYDRVEPPAAEGQPASVVGVVKNRTQRPVASVELRFAFTAEGGGETVVSATGGRIAGDDQIEVRAPMPEGVMSTVKVEATGVALE